MAGPAYLMRPNCPDAFISNTQGRQKPSCDPSCCECSDKRRLRLSPSRRCHRPRRPLRTQSSWRQERKLLEPVDLDQFARRRPRSILRPGRSTSPNPQIVLPQSPGVPPPGLLFRGHDLIVSLLIGLSIERALGPLRWPLAKVVGGP